MSEQTVAEGIQDIIQTIETIQSSSVSIADWSQVDGSLSNAPFIRIDVCEQFEAIQTTRQEVTTWQVPVTIMVKFTDWDESHVAMRDLRQSLIDKFNEAGTNRAAGLDGVNIPVIRNGSPIEPVFNEYNEFEDADPIMLAQVLIFEVEEYA